MRGAKTVSTTPASMRKNSTQITQPRSQGPPAMTMATVSQIRCSQMTAETVKATEAN